MKTDPASRRARNVVALVIVTVALPSLVLTALGVAAIRNEELATKRRLEKLYRPLLAEVADEFNRRFDALLDATKPALTDLLAWSHDPAHDLTRYRRFVDRQPAVTNIFVLDDEGTALAPSFDRDFGSSCCVASECFDVKDFHPQRAAGHDGSNKRRYGSGSAPSARVCSPARRETQVSRLLKTDCTDAAGADPETARLAGTLLSGPTPTEYPQQARYIDQAASLASRLADPTRRIDPWWAQNVARALMYRFEQLPPAQRRWAAGVIALQSQRKALVEGLSRVARTKTGEVVVAGLEVANMRRLVVLFHDGDRTAGFELAPTPFYRDLNRLLSERDLDGQVEAHVGPLMVSEWWSGFLFPEVVTLSKDQLEERVIIWVLCGRSNLNWGFELVFAESGLAGSLGYSRSGLYMWALILVGIALVGGIVHTVRSVIQEARLSRLKTDFVSSVSHDLRTPLTSIRMFSETLRAGRYESETERKEFLQIIIEEAERLSRLTERILDFSRMEAGKKSYRKEATDLRCLVEQALAATKPMIDAAEFEVELDVQPGLPPVPVDRDAMVEVLINLYSNAIKYSPEQRWMGVQITGNGDEVRIRVRDQGIGIRRTEQDRIFEKFYRVDTRRAAEVGGSGIGLSLVKHIVDMHGGAVEVDSTPGHGSTFTVRLPIRPDTIVECAGRRATEEGSWTASWS